MCLIIIGKYVSTIGHYLFVIDSDVKSLHYIGIYFPALISVQMTAFVRKKATNQTINNTIHLNMSVYIRIVSIEILFSFCEQ